MTTEGVELVGPDFAGQSKFHPSQKLGASLIREFFGAVKQARKSVIIYFQCGPGVHISKLNVSNGDFVQASYEIDDGRCDRGSSA